MCSNSIFNLLKRVIDGSFLFLCKMLVSLILPSLDCPQNRQIDLKSVLGQSLLNIFYASNKATDMNKFRPQHISSCRNSKRNLEKNSHRNVAKLFSISRLKIALSFTFEKLVKSYIYWAAKRSLKEGRPYWRKNSTLFSAYINMICHLEKNLFP